MSHSSLASEELVNLDPVVQLLGSTAQQVQARKQQPCCLAGAAKKLPSRTTRAGRFGTVKADKIVRRTPTSCGVIRGWWRALLARHGLYGPGNATRLPPNLCRRFAVSQ